MSEQEQLKPCPFCGDEVTIKLDEDDPYGNDYFYISCGEVGTCSVFAQADNKPDLIAAWNARAQQPVAEQSFLQPQKSERSCEMSEQKQFEAWVLKTSRRSGTHVNKSADGKYLDNRVAAKRSAWLAALEYAREQKLSPLMEFYLKDAQQPAQPIAAELEQYLKEGETAAECIKRNQDDVVAILGLLAKERQRVIAKTGFKLVPIEPTIEMMDGAFDNISLSDAHSTYGVTEHVWHYMLSKAAPDGEKP